LSKLTLAEARQLKDLGEGSMGPKLEAAISFIETGGKKAHIARLDQGLEALHEEAGTTITK
jgi:carbamate kinase